MGEPPATSVISQTGHRGDAPPRAGAVGDPNRGQASIGPGAPAPTPGAFGDMGDTPPSPLAEAVVDRTRWPAAGDNGPPPGATQTSP